MKEKVGDENKAWGKSALRGPFVLFSKRLLVHLGKEVGDIISLYHYHY